MLRALRELSLPQLEEQVRRMSVQAEQKPDKTFTVTIQTDAESIAMTLEVLRLLMGVSNRIYKEVDLAEVHAKGAEQARLLHDKQRAIAQCYWQFRAKGLKHRAALACVLEESSEAKALQFSQSDVNYCVRAYPTESTTLEVSYDSSQCQIE